MQLRSARDVGALIRGRRQELGLTQEQLAGRIGVRRLWVSEVERGKATVELGLVLRALAALGVELRVGGAAEADELDLPDLDAIIERARS